MIWFRYPVWLFWLLGFLGALPLVLDYAGALWWVSLPVIGVVSVIYWFWGMRWMYGADYAAMGTSEKLVALLVGLVQLFIGVVFAVFIATFLVRNWPAVILTVILLVVVFIWAGREPKPKPPKHVGPPRAPQELVPEPSHEPLSPQDWIVRHLAVLLLLGLGGAMTMAMATKRQDLVPPLEFATLGAYIVVAWLHIVGRGEPGKPPYSVLARVGYTFMTVVGTFVGLIILIVAGEAVVEFWMWVVPPVAILAALIGWMLISDHLKARREAAPASPTSRKATDDLVR